MNSSSCATTNNRGDIHRTNPPAGAKLGPPELEHAAQFLGAHLLIEDLLDLPEAEAQILEGDDAIESGELACLVEPVTGERIDHGRHQHADGVVMTQHPDRDPAVPGELPDAEHRNTSKPSHRVRVNPTRRGSISVS